MKQYKILIILLLIIGGVYSCEDNDDDIYVKSSEIIEGISILNSPEVTNFEIVESPTPADGNESEIISFSWTEVNGSYNGIILYFLQIDVVGNNFNNAVYLPVESSGVTSLMQDVTYGEINQSINILNSVLITSGSTLVVDFDNFIDFDVRVVAVSDVSGNRSFSESIPLSINAFEDVVVIEPEAFLVGSVQGYYGSSNWSPEAALGMRYIGDGVTKVFESYIKGTIGDSFKFISNRAIWDDVIGNYGTIGGVQDGNLENNGGSGNIEIPEEGHYYVQLDLDNLTYELVKMEWGIIGSATGGWSDEIPMTYDFNSNEWVIDMNLDDGEVKFRSKQLGNEIYGEDWKFNIGTNLTAWDEGDGNFSASAGSFSIGISLDNKGLATVSGI